jgi:hypothetical protein
MKSNYTAIRTFCENVRLQLSSGYEGFEVENRFEPKGELAVLIFDRDSDDSSSG